MSPIDVIDIGPESDLTEVNVAFIGTEECVNDLSDQRCSDLAMAPQQFTLDNARWNENNRCRIFDAIYGITGRSNPLDRNG